MTSWNWPADFPDDCPPEQASPADGTYYRIVKNAPPDSEDFVSLYDSDQNRAMSIVRQGTRTECETMGLSVYTDRDDAVNCALQYPKIGDRVASVALTPVSGKVLYTGGRFPTHHTWWKPVDFDPTGVAQVVASL